MLAMEPEHIVITCDDVGAIDGAALFRSPTEEAFQAAKKRALVAGSSKCYVFKLIQGTKGMLTFEPITKASRPSQRNR